MMEDMHDLEIYAPIKDFPNYLITSHGRVFSLKDTHDNYRMKEIKQYKGSNGYLCFSASNKSKKKVLSIHRLVAKSFIPNPYNKPQVNHIDEDKTNNHVSNLEWVTVKENANHGTRNKRVSKSLKGRTLSEEHKQNLSLNHSNFKGTNNPCKTKSVIGFKINGCDIKYYKYINECKKDGFSSGNVSSCCQGKRNKHKGYKWFYTDEFFNKRKE